MLPLDFTPCTLDARPLTQGKPGFPAHVALNISLGTSFAQWCTPSLVYASKIKEKEMKYTTYPHRVWSKDTFSNKLNNSTACLLLIDTYYY